MRLHHERAAHEAASLSQGRSVRVETGQSSTIHPTLIRESYSHFSHEPAYTGALDIQDVTKPSSATTIMPNTTPLCQQTNKKQQINHSFLSPHAITCRTTAPTAQPNATQHTRWQTSLISKILAIYTSTTTPYEMPSMILGPI